MSVKSATAAVAHYLFTVKGNQPGLFAQLDALPWASVPVAHTTWDRGHGRVEKRTVQVLPAPPGTRFPHTAQVCLIERYAWDLAGRRISAASPRPTPAHRYTGAE